MDDRGFRTLVREGVQRLGKKLHVREQITTLLGNTHLVFIAIRRFELHQIVDPALLWGFVVSCPVAVLLIVPFDF